MLVLPLSCSMPYISISVQLRTVVCIGCMGEFIELVCNHVERQCAWHIRIVWLSSVSMSLFCYSNLEFQKRTELHRDNNDNRLAKNQWNLMFDIMILCCRRNEIIKVFNLWPINDTYNAMCLAIISSLNGKCGWLIIDRWRYQIWMMILGKGIQWRKKNETSKIIK